MKEVDFNTYKNLLEQGAVSKSSIPKTVLKSDTFEGLMDADILVMSKVGRGLKFSVSKKEDFKIFFETTFPEEIVSKSKSGNIRKFRNSKASKVELRPVYLFRGFNTIKVDGEMVDIEMHTQKFGLFASTVGIVECEKLCFVENLETFLKAENLLGKDFLFVHKYGRIGAESLAIFEPPKEVLVFVDFDFNGLDEYLRIKGVFKNAQFFMPANYDDLFARYSKTLKGNKAKMSKAVRNSKDEIVIKIRETVSRNNRFLEQEILIHD